MTRFAPILTLLVACGSDDPKDSGTATGAGTGTATGTATGSGTGAGTGTGTGATAAGCSTWAITYDLTGSEFAIDALIDFTITLETPYDGDDTMGPGSITLQFQDDGGAPGEGLGTVTDYALSQYFVTGNGLAEVTTDLENTASDSCGVASGQVAGDVLTWGTAALDPYCQTGTITCVGNFCGAGGSPPEGSPVVYNNDCGAQPLGLFTFNADKTGFTAPATIVSQDNNQTSRLTLVGTQTAAVLLTDQPGCLCD